MRRVAAVVPWLTGCQLVFSRPAGPEPDAAPDAAPDAPHNLAFITSRMFDGNLGGLAGADQRCMEAAAQLPAELASARYVAWLSDSTTDAIQRLEGARGWVRHDGQPVADSFTELGILGPRVPISLTENGDDVRGIGRVWTGTDAPGIKHPARCGEWTGMDQGVIGEPSIGAGGFTIFNANNCSESFRLYCFGIDLSAPLPPTPHATPVLFVSAGLWPVGDPGAADALCASEGQSLGGTFRALLTRDGMPPPLPATTELYRVDGVPLGRILSGARANTFPLLTADGTIAPGTRNVWTGGVVTGTPATTCNDWTTSTGATGTAGLLNESTEGAMSETSNLACDTPGHVYCVQTD